MTVSTFGYSSQVTGTKEWCFERVQENGINIEVEIIHALASHITQAELLKYCDVKVMVRHRCCG